MVELTAQIKAHRAVQKAVYRGQLRRLSYHFDAGVRCKDCGKPAQCWDHRDYTEPLDVDPVCAKCNQERGPALTEELNVAEVNFQELLQKIHDRGKSDQWVAAKVGCSRTAIYAIRKGKNREPKYAMGCDLVDLERRTRKRK